MFEAPGIHDSENPCCAMTRINRSRYLWFENYLKSRRLPHSLKDFVATTDDLYASATLDAYAEGWALTFFLAETRHGSYGRYLKRVSWPAIRCWFTRTGEERVADFLQVVRELEVARGRSTCGSTRA